MKETILSFKGFKWMIELDVYLLINELMNTLIVFFHVSETLRNQQEKNPKIQI